MMEFDRGRMLGIALAVCLALVTAGRVFGVEFADPPGQNVKRQESLLKEEISKLASSMIGDKLVEVIVHIGYARTEKMGAGSKNIKLPGFNRFITPSDNNGPEIVPEFLRLRQVFVIVSDEVASESEAIEEDLVSQAEFNRREGDWLRVVPVSMKEQVTGEAAPIEKTAEEEAAEIERQLPETPNEPKSTVYLLKARDAYFAGNYDRSLRHILKAIAVEPNSAQAYAMLGSLYYTINWKNLALKYWEKSLSLDPDNNEIDGLVEQLKENKL